MAGVCALVTCSVGCATNRVLDPKDLRPYVRQVFFQRVDQQGEIQKGPLHIDEKKLRQGLLAKSESKNPFLTQDNRLDHPFAPLLDEERIETFYSGFGYFSTTVTVRYTPCGRGPDLSQVRGVVDVYFCIWEGEPSYVQRVELQGIESLPANEQELLYAQAPWQERLIRAGKTYHKDDTVPPDKRFIYEAETYLSHKEQILLALKRQGYAFATFREISPAERPENKPIQVDRQKYTVDVYYFLVPGVRTTYGEVRVEGCRQTEPSAIVKHIGLVRGEPFHPEDEELIRARLYALGLFNLVEVKMVPRAGQPSVADVNIVVKEVPPQEMLVGLGFGIEPSRTEVHLRTVYTHHNVRGRLETIRLRAQFGYAAIPAFWSSPIVRHGPVADVDFLYEKPNLLGSYSKLQLNLGYNLANEISYAFHGPALGLGIQRSFWKRRISLELSYHFQLLNFFDTEEVILQDPDRAGPLFGYTNPYRLGYLRQHAFLDLRNRPLDATRGLYVSFLAEEGGVYTGSAFNYQKLVPEVRAYWSFFQDRWVFAGRVLFGQLFSSGDFGSPVTQRFYLGGPNSHRGFSYNRLSYQVCAGQPNKTDPTQPPPILCDPETPNANRVPAGGDQMFLAQLETRVNLFRVFGQWLSVAAFVDAGDVVAPKLDDQHPALDFSQLHVAVGGGLRLRTLIGVVRFDLGARLNRLDYKTNEYLNPDPGQRFVYHLSIGESF